MTKTLISLVVGHPIIVPLIKDLSYTNLLLFHKFYTHMHVLMLSPRFTTQYSEMIEVRCIECSNPEKKMSSRRASFFCSQWIRLDPTLVVQSEKTVYFWKIGPLLQSKLLGPLLSGNDHPIRIISKILYLFLRHPVIFCNMGGRKKLIIYDPKALKEKATYSWFQNQKVVSLVWGAKNVITRSIHRKNHSCVYPAWQEIVAYQ